MNIRARWIASLTLSPLAVLTLQGAALDAQAFTDANADMKEVQRAERVVVAGKAARPPSQTAWVPTSPKRLDSFKPVLPPEEAPRTVAKVEVPASARR